LETRTQPILELRDGLRLTVGAKDDLLPLLVDRVEGVEELLLGSFLAGDELDVVDEQDVDAAVTLSKLLALLAADGIDEFIGELFARRVHDALLGVARQHGMPDGVHQMCLAQPDATVDEQW